MKSHLLSITVICLPIQIIGFNPATSEVEDVIHLPKSTDGAIVDVAFDRNFGILYVLTDKSLLHFQL